jgi:hypothetical protein
MLNLVLACLWSILWHHQPCSLFSTNCAAVVLISMYRMQAVHALLGLAPWCVLVLVACQGSSDVVTAGVQFRWRLPAQVTGCSWQPGLLVFLAELVCTVFAYLASLQHAQPPAGCANCVTHLLQPLCHASGFKCVQSDSPSLLPHRQGNQDRLGMARATSFACTSAEACLSPPCLFRRSC